MSSHASTSRLPLPLSPHRPSRLDKGKRRAKVVIDLTLSDSSDSEPTPSDDSDDSEVEILPPKKRSRLPPPPTPTLAPVPRKPLGERTSHHNNNASSDDADAASRALAEQLAAEDAAAVSEERIAREEAASLALLEELAAEDERASRRREEDDLRGELAAQQEQEREAREWAAILDEKEKERDAVVFQVTMDSQGRTLEGDEDGDNLAHLAKVKQVFATGITQGLQIITVTYFVNHALNCRFEEAKQALLDAGRSVAEHTLFHGTTDQNNGFLVGGNGTAVVNGTAYGPGVYLAQNPSTSLGYCKGGNRMIACQVLPGKISPSPLMTAPRAAGKDKYDSWSGAGLGSTIHVVRDPRLVLPSYVIEFTWPGQAAAATLARQMAALTSGVKVPAVKKPRTALAPRKRGRK